MYLFVFYALFASADVKQRIFGSLLPEPQEIEIIGEESGVCLDSIVGFRLYGKAEIPFGQKKFPDRICSAKERNTINLHLDKGISHREGYRIVVQNGKIDITAKTKSGLFYGLQTLAQLAENTKELGLPLPAFKITDEPDADYRAIHIDLKHHLDKMDYMYQVLDRMAYYKLNAVIIEFEDKLKYENYPVIASPNAPGIKEWSEWCAYANRLNIEVSPLIQGIGHADYILKHQEFKALREDSLSDWVCCPSNEEYYKLQFSLYDDAIKATPYGKYVHIGGDEVGNLGTCPVCKPMNKTTLEHQLKWLKRVSDYIVKQGRTPIFWDDMVYKQVGLYDVILDVEKPEKMDSVWQAHLPELNEYINQFPRNVVYMRWQYGNANRKGNKMALKWYNDNGLSVMGATAAQTTYPMMTLGNGNVENIKSFQLAHQTTPVTGVLCTAWDDASALSDTYWKGFIAHAQYSWNIKKVMDEADFSERYRIREFGNGIVELPDFRKELESTFPLWETGLLDEGVRRGMWRTQGRYKMITLPTEVKGEWSRKYDQRLRQAKINVVKYWELKNLLLEYRKSAVRNDYSLQVFERINELTGYTARLLLALSAYDIERDASSLSDLCHCMEEFATVRENMEQVYFKIRYVNQPVGYMLPMNHHAHLAIRSLNSDWMYLYELDMLKQLRDFLSGIPSLHISEEPKK